MVEPAISSDNPYAYKRAPVLDSEMAYIEAGAGAPIVLIHGNPTSSYLWRNVIPHVESLGRCLAPDLMGMGQSGKIPDGGYRYLDHARYLDVWFDLVIPDERIIFVVQDWGAALSFDWGNRHRDRVRAICYMEAMVQPRRWTDLPEAYRTTFQGFRTPEGLKAAVEANLFIEKVLPNGVARPLNDTEMSVYRAPYIDDADRMPTIQWPREIPFDGEPADNHATVRDYAEWLVASADIPKLFVNTTSGHALLGRNRDFCRTWPNQEEVTLNGKHYIQEDAPKGLGLALADWIGRLP